MLHIAGGAVKVMEFSRFRDCGFMRKNGMRTQLSAEIPDPLPRLRVRIPCSGVTRCTSEAKPSLVLVNHSLCPAS